MLCLHKFRMGFDMDAFWITRLFIRVRHNFQLVWLMSAFSSKWSEIQTPKQPISSTSYWSIFNSKWYTKSSDTLLISKLKHQNTVDGIYININSSENALLFERLVHTLQNRQMTILCYTGAKTPSINMHIARSTATKKKQENKKHIKLLWLFIQNGCVGLALWKSSGSVQKLIKFVCMQIYYCHIILHGKDHRRFNLRCKRFVFRSKIQNRNFNSCACHAVIKYLRPLPFFVSNTHEIGDYIMGKSCKRRYN